jgi:phenylpyruvate tautomerase PptA (4-oxalocrotonate tautomerase family)
VICQFRETHPGSQDSTEARKDKILKEVSEVFESTLKKLKE